MKTLFLGTLLVTLWLPLGLMAQTAAGPVKKGPVGI
jgi:hypothetical protein